MTERDGAPVLRRVIEAVFQTRVILRAGAGIHDSRQREPHHRLGDRVVWCEEVGEEGVGAAVVGAAWFGEAEADGGFDVRDGPGGGGLFHGWVVHLETAVADDGGAVAVGLGVRDGLLGWGVGFLGGWDLVVHCKPGKSAQREKSRGDDLPLDPAATYSKSSHMSERIKSFFVSGDGGISVNKEHENSV